MEDARVLVSTSWQQRLQNEEYKNWLKIGYALTKMCGGIRSYIETEAKGFHASLATTVHGLPRCTCTHRPRRRPNPYHDMMNCSWAKELERHHMKGRPTWSQSNASLWHDPHAGHWEVAKLYMPYGCAKGNSFAETDATGLLNLLFFCNYYKTDRTLVERLKDMRNAWAHAATQELDATETTNAFSLMKNFLQDAELVGNADAIEALNEIIAFENDDLIDFKKLETKVVKELKQSMTSLKDELATKIDSMKDQGDIHASEIKDEIFQINGILNYCINVAKERDSVLLDILLDTQSALRDMQAQLAIQNRESSKRKRFVQNVLGFCKPMILLTVLLYLRLPKRVPRKCIILVFLLSSITILNDSLEGIGCGNEHKFHDPLELKEFDFSEHLNQGRKDFVGRQWLFKDVLDILNQESKGILIIAAPGFGKSALVSNLICSKLSSFSLHSQILGYHFCIHSHKNTQNGAKFVRNLANMITWRLREYKYLVTNDKFVHKTLRDGCASDPSACFEHGILSPLSALRLRFLKPMYIIVDAIDECFGDYELDKTTSILNILSNNIKKFPNWLKVIITSRNVTYFKRKFSSLGVVDLYQSDPRNLRDIERFITSHIPFSPLYRIKSYFTISDYSIQALVNKSQGNFLFIKLVLEYLQTKGVSAATWNSLPTSINSIYQEFFERNFNTKEKFRRPRKIFEILVATLSPMTREELYNVLLMNEKPEDFHDFEYDFLPILEELSVYLRNAKKNQTLTVFHNSLIEWLTSKSNEGSMFYVNEKKGNRLLADYFLRKCHNKSINITPRLVFNLATYITKGGKLKSHTDEFLRLDSKLVEIKEERTKLNALHFAATSDNKNILDMLLSFFKDLNVEDYNGRTPAFYAALSGHLENLILLHEEGASLSTVTNPSSSLEVQKDFLDEINNCKTQMCEYSLLHVAAQQGHEKIVEYLISNGVDISSLSGTGSSAIHLAAEYGHVGVMKILLKHEAVADDTCLYYAAFRGHVDAVKFLLENEVTDNCIDCSKIRNSHLRKSYSLVSYGNYTRHCNTALHAAAIGNHPDVMELLLKPRQNAIGCVNLFGREPLHEAVHHENYEAAHVLLKFGVKTSGICRTTLTDLSQHGHEPCPCGYTPLHLAVHHGFAAITNLLLEHKADYNATDCEGMQPIHVASCREHAEVLPILVQHGANINSKGPNDMTPLHYACKCQADQVLDTLFELGADDSALTINKKTPAYFIFQDALIYKIFLLDPYVDNPIDPITFDPRGRAKSLQSKKVHNWFRFFMKFMNSLIRVSSTTMSFKERLIASLTNTKDQTRLVMIKEYFIQLFNTFEYRVLYGSTWSGMLDLFLYTTPAYGFYLDMVLVEPKLQEEYLNEFQLSKENILPTGFKKIFLKLFCKLNCSHAIRSIEQNLVFTTDSFFDLGVDANCEDSGSTPIRVYLRKGGSNMAKVLVKHNVTIKIRCNEYFEDSDFHLAAYHKLHYLQYLSVFQPSNKWEEYIKKENALFDYLFDEYDKKTVGEQVKVTRVGDGPVTKAIKSDTRGYTVIDECLDSEGYTALHRAAQGGNVVAVKHFLDWGANATKKSPEGFDALTLAIWYAVKYRPYLNLHEESLLTSLETEFASLTASAILEHLTKNEPFDIGCDATKKTPTLLHLAATRGMWRFIDDLFVARDRHRVTGLTANCPTKDNITPMYLAKLHGGDDCDWDNPWCKVVEVLKKYSESGYIEVRPQPFMEYFLILNFLFHELPERLRLDLDKKELTILKHSYKYCKSSVFQNTICFPADDDVDFFDIIEPLDLSLFKFGVANTDFDFFLNSEISKIKATFFHLKNIKSGKCTKKKHSTKTTKQLPYTYKPNDSSTRTSPIRRCSCSDGFRGVQLDPDKVINFIIHPPEDTCFLDVCSPYRAIGIKIVDQVLRENYAVVKSYYQSLKTEMKKIRRALRKYVILRGKSYDLIENTLYEYKRRRTCMFEAIIFKYARLKFFLHTIKFWSVQVNKNNVLPFMSKYLFDKVQDVFLNENEHKMTLLILQLAKHYPSKYEYLKMMRFTKPPLFYRTVKPIPDT